MQRTRQPQITPAWAQPRFVVVGLKIGAFQPEYVGTLGFYVAWVEDNLRVRDRVVRYSLVGGTAPLAVAGYTYDTLPDRVRAAVPTDAELCEAVGTTLTELDAARRP